MKYRSRKSATSSESLRPELESSSRTNSAGSVPESARPELAEVVVAGDLAAERRAVLAHRDLEERVTDPVAMRGAAELGHGVGHRAAGPHVVDDARAGLLGEHLAGEHRGQEVAVDELATVVDEEAAVGVAVPGDAEVGALVEHPPDHELAVLGQQRVGLVVGKLAVGHPVGLGEVEPEALEQRSDHRARHAVAAVDDDLQRAHGRGVDLRQGVGLKRVVDVHGLDLAAARLVAEARLDQRLDLADPRVAGERERALADELDAGVGLWVVRGGDHRPAVELLGADEEIEHLGADHPGVDDRDPLGHQALDRAAGHVGRGQTHVAADPDPKLARLLVAQVGEHPGEGAADRPRRGLVHLGAVQAADVVGLEDARRREHAVVVGVSQRRPSASRSSARAIAASHGCRRAPA